MKASVGIYNFSFSEGFVNYHIFWEPTALYIVHAVKTQLKNTHFPVLQMNFPFKSGVLIYLFAFVRMVVLTATGK